MNHIFKGELQMNFLYAGCSHLSQEAYLEMRLREAGISRKKVNKIKQIVLSKAAEKMS
jgi:hypothetical protein